LTDDHPLRHLDAPFTPPDLWTCIPGRCSRCQQPALLGETRWQHVGESCPANGPTAEFLPD